MILRLLFPLYLTRHHGYPWVPLTVDFHKDTKLRMHLFRYIQRKFLLEVRSYSALRTRLFADKYKPTVFGFVTDGLVVLVGIFVSISMDCWSEPFHSETNTIKFDYWSKIILDEGSVVEIEFKVWSVLWVGVSCVTTLDCHNSHPRQNICNAVTRDVVEKDSLRII